MPSREAAAVGARGAIRSWFQSIGSRPPAALLRGLGLGKRRDPLSSREHRALAPDLRETCEWRTERHSPPVDNELYEIFRGSPGAYKWRHYFDAYTDVLAPHRDRPINFLEIGVFKGGSLRMWRKYLHPDSIIVGIDIAPACRSYEAPSRHVFVRIGDQGDEAFLRAVVEEFGPFDVVVDDGSHQAADVLASFNLLFAAGMKDEGIYIVEDLHTSYHPGFVGKHLPFLDIVKQLIDAMHAHYHRMHGLSGGAFSPDSETSFLVPRITTTLDQIRIFDSMVVLYRKVGRQTPVSELARAAAGELR